MNNETEGIFIITPPANQPPATSQKLEEASVTTPQDVEDFSTVCRTCATVTEFVIPIFDGEGLQNNLAEKIHKHLPIRVCETDILPRVVCYQCASTLLAWHELVQCCVQADAALRTRLAVCAAAAVASADNTPQEKPLESECSSKEAQNTENEQQNKFKEIAEFVVQSLEPPQYESPQVAPKPCGYCGARLAPLAYREHLVAAHSDSLFHCDECDTYVDRKDFILHMSLHAVEYAAKQDKKIKKYKKKLEVKAGNGNENRKCYSRKPKNQDGGRKAIECTSHQKNEFSDHSDTEFGFGPLPESVFEAIEDSQESQSNSKIYNAIESSQDSQPNTDIFEDIEDTMGSVPNDIEISSSQVINKVDSPEDTMGSVPNAMEMISSQVINKEDSPRDTMDSVPNHIEISSTQVTNIEESPGETIVSVPNDIERSSSQVMSEEESSEKRDTHKESLELVKTALGPPEPNEKSHKKSRTCPICGKAYTASSSYFYHMKHFHKRSKDHECDVCGKRFGTKACLVQHKAIHTGECRYECKECGKKFRSKASLYIHEQTHNGVKSWACSQCQISFRWRTHLVRHMKRHSAEKAHVCGTCGRGFSIHCDLLRHARTHVAGDFACEKCGVKFAQRRYLKVHMDRKHSTSVTANHIVADKERSDKVVEKEPPTIDAQNVVPQPHV